jgi:hypothetical protein
VNPLVHGWRGGHDRDAAVSRGEGSCFQPPSSRVLICARELMGVRCRGLGKCGFGCVRGCSFQVGCDSFGAEEGVFVGEFGEVCCSGRGFRWLWCGR